MAMPDVFSIRHTTLEDAVAPLVHEVKVRRADLLGDLKRPAKGEAYRALSSECWYVIKAGIGRARKFPVYGVMAAHPRPRPRLANPPLMARWRCCARRPSRPFVLPFAVWMALARATPEPVEDDEAQGLLGEQAGLGAPRRLKPDL